MKKTEKPLDININSIKLYEALTRFNYFPNQKGGILEIPPCFSSCLYSPAVVKELVKLQESKERRKSGYDHVEYYSTRYNNVSRSLALPHPYGYSYFVAEMVASWENIKHVMDNERSLIKPEFHQDGRILVMNYEDSEKKISRSLNDEFSKLFRVHTDITNCFNSIYTHAIPWALIGFENAKSNRDPSLWYNRLDAMQRKIKRNETQGVPVGPAVSSIIAEIILGAVDNILAKKGYEFRRYVDDYTCYCSSHDEAKKFIHDLSQELKVYKLNLNIKKTRIDELPKTLSDDWVVELSSLLPKGTGDDGEVLFNRFESMAFLDSALKLKMHTPDGSVLKYAVNSIINHLDKDAIQPVLKYLLTLCWHYPLLLPYLEKFFNDDSIEPMDFESQLNKLVIENAKNHRSDGITWPLYYINKYKLSISQGAFEATMESRDCLGILCLYASGKFIPEVVKYAEEIALLTFYEKDQYWILLYQLYLDQQITDPYNDGCFPILKSSSVTFMPSEEIVLKVAQEISQSFTKLAFSDLFGKGLNFPIDK